MRTDETKEKEPYKNLFPNVSFIGSILFSISLAAAISLPSSATFFGSDDVKMLARVHQSAFFFAWSACANGASLILSLLMQMLYTSPHFHTLATSNEHKRTVRWIVGTVAWVSLLLAASGVALVAEGLKVVERKAGLMLQWLLFAFCFPVSCFWIVLRGEDSRTVFIEYNLLKWGCSGPYY